MEEKLDTRLSTAPTFDRLWCVQGKTDTRVLTENLSEFDSELDWIHDIDVETLNKHQRRLTQRRLDRNMSRRRRRESLGAFIKTNLLKHSFIFLTAAQSAQIHEAITCY